MAWLAANSIGAGVGFDDAGRLTGSSWGQLTGRDWSSAGGGILVAFADIDQERGTGAIGFLFSFGLDYESESNRRLALGLEKYFGDRIARGLQFLDSATKLAEWSFSTGDSSGGGQKTVDDLIGESTKGRETKGRSDQYNHGGGREQRDRDFDSLGATDVRDRGNGTKTGTLPDGRPVNVHDSKTDGVPTIQIGSGSREVKIRYP